jgi:hypothetical protein
LNASELFPKRYCYRFKDNLGKYKIHTRETVCFPFLLLELFR